MLVIGVYKAVDKAFARIEEVNNIFCQIFIAEHIVHQNTGCYVTDWTYISELGGKFSIKSDGDTYFTAYADYGNISYSINQDSVFSVREF